MRAQAVQAFSKCCLVMILRSIQVEKDSWLEAFLSLTISATLGAHRGELGTLQAEAEAMLQ
eukprot:3686527-Amphidinium_carterae.1